MTLKKAIEKVSWFLQDYQLSQYSLIHSLFSKINTYCLPSVLYIHT